MRSLLIAFVAVAVVACADGPPSSVGKGSLRISAQTPTELAGQYVAVDGTTLSFRSVQSSEWVIDLSYDLGDVTVAMNIDYAQGVLIFDSNGGVFTPEHEQTMLGFYDILATVVSSDQGVRTMAEEYMIRETGYMAKAPVGDALPSTFTSTSERGWTYLSCSCQTQNIGSGYYRQAGVGTGCTGGSGNGCKGRCGVGCGYDNQYYYLQGSYTQDCAKHDYGLGSWTSASDDYAFAWYNCG